MTVTSSVSATSSVLASTSSSNGSEPITILTRTVNILESNGNNSKNNKKGEVENGKEKDQHEGNSNDDHHRRRKLILLFLGCEAKPPYGPYEHTARLFLDLISRALEVKTKQQQQQQEQDQKEKVNDVNPKTTQKNNNANNKTKKNDDDGMVSLNIIIKVYGVSMGNFPKHDEYSNCHGVILPGSFNSAYDNEIWIEQLKYNVIQNILVKNGSPTTLGICFGHQIYAHSFLQQEQKPRESQQQPNSSNDDVNHLDDTKIVNKKSKLDDEKSVPTIDIASESAAAEDSRGDDKKEDHVHHRHHRGGRATKCPAGPQAGRRCSKFTEHGERYLLQEFLSSSSDDMSLINDVHNDLKKSSTSNSNDNNTKLPVDDKKQDEIEIDNINTNDDIKDGLQLYYTHGDMVDTLPPQAVPLMGTEQVPIQAALYYFDHHCNDDDTNSKNHEDNVTTTHQSQDGHGQDYEYRQIMAITFQAHPEYGGSSFELGIKQTFNPILELMYQRNDITQEEYEAAKKDGQHQEEQSRNSSVSYPSSSPSSTYSIVERQSIQTMIVAGKLLKWVGFV